ncbi:type II secretion system protein GspL, partial [Burkholderia pseudomallei]
MSTLIVLLPPREPAVPLQEWQWPELPFALVDKSGHTQRAGRAALALLPQAATTVLIVAARDLLMLEQALPPLKGPRLKQALPNIIEDQLIQDPQGCHIAVDPAALDGGRRVLAVIDRAWFKFIVDAFTAAGHRHLRAVPVTRCLPPATRRDAAAAAETEAVADVALDRPAGHAAAADAPGSGHAGATANAPAPAESIVAVALGLAATERAPSLAEEPAALLPQAPSAPRVELALA